MGLPVCTHFEVCKNIDEVFGIIEEWRRIRSEEHTSELQSRGHLVCRLLLLRTLTSTLFPYTTLFRSREVSRRPIRFFAFDLILSDENREWTHQEKLRRLKKMGLPVCTHFEVCKNIDEVFGIIEEWRRIRQDLPYEIDGVVVKVNEEKYYQELGTTSKFPRWAISYKYEAEQATTLLESITLQVGRLGKITPVAELTPVLLAGTTVKRASLHNEDEILRKDIRPGDSVVIEKAGEIIPQVISVLNPDREDRSPPFSMPEHCPACGEGLVKPEGEVAWRCINPKCPPQARERIKHFASRDAMDIEGLGEAVVS